MRPLFQTRPNTIRRPTVSVLMPVYNAAPFVGAAIESVLTQSFDDLELLILDDGSTDASLSILTTYAARDDRVRWQSRPNRGLIATRNELLDLAQGKYCALLDADDVALPERLSQQVAYLESHPECVVLGSRVLLIDSHGAPLCEMVDEFEPEPLYARLLAGTGHNLCNPAITMRRSALQQTGGYREGYEPAEDLELFLRLAEHGTVANLPDVLTHYRQHLKSESHTRRERQCQAAFRAVNEARRRQSLPDLCLEDTIYAPRRLSPADHYRKWCWWALGAGRVATARKYALASARRRPFDVESWRALYCSFRGR